jgi:hypothetical protein
MLVDEADAEIEGRDLVPFEFDRGRCGKAKRRADGD